MALLYNSRLKSHEHLNKIPAISKTQPKGKQNHACPTKCRLPCLVRSRMRRFPSSVSNTGNTRNTLGIGKEVIETKKELRIALCKAMIQPDIADISAEIPSFLQDWFHTVHKTNRGSSSWDVVYETRIPDEEKIGLPLSLEEAQAESAEEVPCARCTKPIIDRPPPADPTITALEESKPDADSEEPRIGRPPKFGKSGALVVKTERKTASGKPARVTKKGCAVTVRLPESWRQRAKEFAEKTNRPLTDVFLSGLAREFIARGCPLPTDPPMPNPDTQDGGARGNLAAAGTRVAMKKKIARKSGGAAANAP